MTQGARSPGAPLGPARQRGSAARQGLLRINPQGRVVIPAALRRALGLQPGDVLVARAEEGRLVLEKRADILKRLQDWFAGVPRDVSLVDELLAERRAEARQEEQD